MKKNLKRLLSLVLATTLLLLPSARSVSAQGDDGIATPPATEVAQDDSAVQTEATNPGITEVVSRREENVKHFDMGDGTYQAVAYARPIHELDSEGNWQNIETGLQLSTAGSTACYTADQMGVTFAQRIGTTQPLMALNEAGNSISLNFVPSQTSLTRSSFASIPATVENAPIKTEQTHFDTFEEATNIDLSSSITYSEVQPNTDIEYIVEPGLVKENIVVKDSKSSYIYDFSLNLTGLYPVMLNDGSILIYDSDTDEMCYAIPAPYMYDALGNLSEDVWYTLSGSNGAYTLTVEASAAWINDSNRTFPVTIDPTISTTTDGIDTFIDVARPDEIFGLRQSLWVRKENTMITYIDPPTVAIPSGYHLVTASLMCYYYYYDYVTTGTVTAGAYQVYLPWEEATFNWNVASQDVNNGIYSNNLLDTSKAKGGTVITSPMLLSFDITSAANHWMKNPNSNHGIAIKHEGGDNWSFAIRSYQSGGFYPFSLYTYRAPLPYTITNYRDSTFEGMDYLDEALSFVEDVYREEFNIFFTYSTEATPYAGHLPANCGIMKFCSENPCDLPHHKDVGHISDVFNAQITDGNIDILWSDNEYTTFCRHDNRNLCSELPCEDENCLHNECERVKEEILAIVFDHRPFIHILNIQDSEYEACMALALAHEIAHTFGLDEAYYNSNHKNDGIPCIMDEYSKYYPLESEEFYEAIKNGEDPFCPSCKRNIDVLIGGQLVHSNNQGSENDE